MREIKKENIKKEDISKMPEIKQENFENENFMNLPEIKKENFIKDFLPEIKQEKYTKNVSAKNFTNFLCNEKFRECELINQP